MLTFVIILQVLVALFLILVVLLQPGNRGGASAALGGAGSDTVFGARGANTFLSKITFGAAVCFMVTNFLLSFMSSSMGKRSVLDALEKTNKTVPAAEAPAPTEVAPEKAEEAAPEKAQEAAPEKAGDKAPSAPNAEAPHEQGAAQ
jgi:preprotein translocase subunit SecG